MKRYFIKTFGCQANTADSEQLAGMLEAMGMLEAKKLLEADVFIVNSCSIRQAAEDKIYGLAKKAEVLKAERPEAKIILTGCMVGSAKGERRRYPLSLMQKRLPWVDAFLATYEQGQVPGLLTEWGIISARDARLSAGAQAKHKDHEHAYVNVSTGCDNFCTFCVVPYARGRETHRGEEEILREISHLTKAGFSRFTLVGQNVNSWGLDPERKMRSRKHIGKLPFAKLLRSVHAIKGVEKIDFISSNPFDFTPDLVGALKLPKISRYLHMALQSGDDEILRRMNRRHSAADFLELVCEIRQAVSDIELGTDLIVGFPGETFAQFENTVKLVQAIGFNVAYVSMYSERTGTMAQRMYKDDVPKSEKKRRHEVLMKALEQSKAEHII